MNKVKREETRKNRALLGSLKGFSEGVVRLFELTTPSGSHCTEQHLFQPYTGAGLDVREIQTFPAWKVQNDFRKLHFRQRMRLKRNVVYLQPIGPFPASVHGAVQGLHCSLFQLLQNFMGAFFHGMPVRLQETIMLDKINCKTRIHPDTKKLQLLVKDVQAFLKESIPSDGFCIVGITWVDLYPSDEWNFVLGEASCEDGCAVICFGHYEPQTYNKKPLTQESTATNEPTSTLKIGANAQPLIQTEDTQKSGQYASATAGSLIESNLTQELDSGPQNVRNVDVSQDCEFEKGRKHPSGSVKTHGKCSSSLQVGEECSEDLNVSESVAAPVTNVGQKPSGSVGFGNKPSDSRQDKCSSLSEKFADLDRVDGKIIWRLFRGISHEASHITGMAHCAYYACAMNESKSVQEAESQPMFMCPVCLRKLQKAVGFDIVQRYEALHAFLTSLCNGLSCDDQGDKHSNPPDGSVSQHAKQTRSFRETTTNFESSLVWLQSVLAFIRTDGECHKAASDTEM